MLILDVNRALLLTWLSRRYGAAAGLARLHQLVAARRRHVTRLQRDGAFLAEVHG